MNDKNVSPAVSPVLITALLILVLACAATWLYRLHASSNPIAAATPTVSTAPTSAASTTLPIPELGIKITIPSPISDADYAYIKVAKKDIAHFSTTSLAKLGGSGCSSSNGPIGSIEVSDSPESSAEEGALVKVMGSRYVYLASPQAICSNPESVSADDLQSKQTTLLKQAANSISPLN